MQHEHELGSELGKENMIMCNTARLRVQDFMGERKTLRKNIKHSNLKHGWDPNVTHLGAGHECSHLWWNIAIKPTIS